MVSLARLLILGSWQCLRVIYGIGLIIGVLGLILSAHQRNGVSRSFAHRDFCPPFFCEVVAWVEGWLFSQKHWHAPGRKYMARSSRHLGKFHRAYRDDHIDPRINPLPLRKLARQGAGKGPAAHDPGRAWPARAQKSSEIGFQQDRC